MKGSRHEQEQQKPTVSEKWRQEKKGKQQYWWRAN